MAYRVAAAGRSLAEPVHYDGRSETEALKARYADVARGEIRWIRGPVLCAGPRMRQYDKST